MLLDHLINTFLFLKGQEAEACSGGDKRSSKVVMVGTVMPAVVAEMVINKGDVHSLTSTILSLRVVTLQYK